MDDPCLDALVHLRALRGLRRINWLSATTGSFWKQIIPLARTSSKNLRILDVGAGSGDLVIDLWRRARRAGLAMQVDGCDVSERAVEFARSRAGTVGAPAQFHVHDATNDPMPPGYDVIISSLLLHHLQDEQIVAFLRRAGTAAGEMLLMNDLVRSRAGYSLAWWGTRMLSRSPVVHSDGPQSVRAALTVVELRGLAIDGGLNDVAIRSLSPCRMMLIWRRP